MPVDPKTIAKMRARVASLEALLKVAELEHGRKLQLFAADGGLHLIDVGRDNEITREDGMNPERTRSYPDGSIVADLGGGNAFDGGGW